MKIHFNLTSATLVKPQDDREEADAAALLVRHRNRDGSALTDQQIRSTIRLARDVTRMTNIALADAIARAITLRGYQPPEPFEEALARLSVKHGIKPDAVKDSATRWSRVRITEDGKQRFLNQDEILVALNTSFTAACVAGASLAHVEASMQSFFHTVMKDMPPAPDPVFGSGPLRDYQITNHGHPLSPESPANHAAPVEDSEVIWTDGFGNRVTPPVFPAPEEPAARPDLTAEELDAALLKFSDESFPHFSIPEIREFARAVREQIPECSNRYILESATHVYTEEPAPPAPAPSTFKVEIELSEEEAACWWADVTWNGRSPRTIDAITRDHVMNHLRRLMRNAARMPQEKAEAVADFRKLHPH